MISDVPIAFTNGGKKTSVLMFFLNTKIRQSHQIFKLIAYFLKNLNYTEA